jgi:glycerophosphoryl diester phosphodiesterase
LAVKTSAIVAAWSTSIIPPIFSSFSLKASLALRHHDAQCQLGLLLEEWVEDWEIIANKLNCVAVHLDQVCLTKARVTEIKATGRAVLTYTVNTAERARELQDIKSHVWRHLNQITFTMMFNR